MKFFKKLFVSLLIFSGMCAPLRAMTIAQILTEVRIRIKDTNITRQRYSNAQLNNFLITAARDMSIAARPILNTAHTVLSAGTTCYDLSADAPSGIIDIKRAVFYAPSGRIPLPETTMEQLESVSGTQWALQGGIPQAYYFDNTRLTQVCMWPWPNGVTGSTGTFVVYFYQGGGTDDAITDSSQDMFGSLNLRFINYHDLFVWHMCADIYELEGETEKVTYYRTLYESRLKMMKDQIYSKENYNPSFSGPNNSR